MFEAVILGVVLMVIAIYLGVKYTNGLEDFDWDDDDE